MNRPFRRAWRNSATRCRPPRRGSLNWFAAVPGVILEDKRWTLSVHYRLADHDVLPELGHARPEDRARARAGRHRRKGSARASSPGSDQQGYRRDRPGRATRRAESRRVDPLRRRRRDGRRHVARGARTGSLVGDRGRRAGAACSADGRRVFRRFAEQRCCELLDAVSSASDRPRRASADYFRFFAGLVALAGLAGLVRASRTWSSPLGAGFACRRSWPAERAAAPACAATVDPAERFRRRSAARRRASWRPASRMAPRGLRPSARPLRLLPPRALDASLLAVALSLFTGRPLVVRRLGFADQLVRLPPASSARDAPCIERDRGRSRWQNRRFRRPR